MKDKFVKVCPRCGSTNIISEYSGHQPRDACGDCGLHRYMGTLLPEKTFAPILEIKDSELENFREQLKKTPIIKQ